MDKYQRYGAAAAEAIFYDTTLIISFFRAAILSFCHGIQDNVDLFTDLSTQQFIKTKMDSAYKRKLLTTKRHPT